MHCLVAIDNRSSLDYYVAYTSCTYKCLSAISSKDALAFQESIYQQEITVTFLLLLRPSYGSVVVLDIVEYMYWRSNTNTINSLSKDRQGMKMT